ncbi:MAG: TonB-dependent receptor [Candidatus Eiseniibacteriota bacterium]
MRPGPLILSCAACLGLTLEIPASSFAQGSPSASSPGNAPTSAPANVPASRPGIVRGVVLDGKEPVPAANINLYGTTRGAQTDESGQFVIRNVPPGVHRLKVLLTGREAKIVTVTVAAGENLPVTIQVGDIKVVNLPEFEVVARQDVDVKRSDTMTKLNSDKIKEFRLDTLNDVIAVATPGIVVMDDGLHARGGRAGEIKTTIDGIPVADPLFGGSPTISPLAVGGAEVITGGISAEYGDVLSGVVSIVTKEGGEKFGGEVQWHTDRYGENTKTFDNFDRIALGLGGPTPVPRLTWFASFDGTFTDTYLDAGITQERNTLFDFLRLGDRQSNQVNMNMKLAWKPSLARKITFEVLRNRGLETPYEHMWSRKGYVQVTEEPVENSDGTTSLVRTFGRWSFFQEDSTFQYMNMADHVQTFDTRFAQEKLVWQDSPSKLDVVTVRVSRFRFDTEASVQDKEPWEYDTRQPFYWSGNVENDPYFATHGDFPVWTSQSTATWTFNADWTTRHWKNHLAKAGVQGIYNALELVDLRFPNDETQGAPGLLRSDYANYHPEASVYVQDRWEFEGLVLNAGVRYDMFTPGQQLTDEELPNGRYKQQLSPRLGVAYPISTNDALSFFYGWTFQNPARNFVFENRDANAAVVTRGNPDLEPETVISYQAAVQHMFSKDVSGQFAVFYKDIFGLISTRQMVDELTGLLVPVFVNRDYASARGFETSIRKRFSHRFSVDVNYTYQIASGVASDPNAGLQFAQGNQLYLPISEQPLVWDQRHTLNANLVLRDAGKWGLTMLWTFGSGLPYTPTFRNDRKPDPRFTNSRRQPSRSELAIAADKFFRIWGQNVTFFVDARNVLDAQAIRDISPGNFPNPFINQVGADDYDIYYTETGRVGGAYLKDTNGDGEEDWVAVNDPRVLAEGRRIRVGAGVTF